MADCHFLFSNFNNLIRLTEERRQALLAARTNLAERITSGFNTINARGSLAHSLDFQTQGSFIMDTIINPISEDYDLDCGVYFIGPAPRDQRPQTKVFHDFVVKCVKENNPNVREVKDKVTCVRALYNEGYSYIFESKAQKLQKGFHIDLPIYYAGTKKSPDLAHLKKEWIVSDPIEFIEWFEKKVKSSFKSEFLYEQKLFSEGYKQWQDAVRKEDVQLRKIVRYLKAWCDYQGGDMPCGLVLTILAAENYVADSRDDISLYHTLTNIKTTLDKEFCCKRPTTPKGDDILADYKNKDGFLNKLATFLASAKIAIGEVNQKRACLKWQEHLGDRFSCNAAANYDVEPQKATAPAIFPASAKSA